LLIVVIVVILLLSIRVLYIVNCSHPGEVGSGLLWTSGRSGCILFPLDIQTGSPLLHGFLIGEFYDEVLNSGVALPPYLYRVRTYTRIGKIIIYSFDDPFSDMTNLASQMTVPQ